MIIDTNEPEFAVDIYRHTGSPVNGYECFTISLNNMASGRVESIHFHYKNFSDIENLLDKFSIEVQAMKDRIDESESAKASASGTEVPKGIV